MPRKGYMNLAVILLMGCATPYQRIGLGGGYSETVLGESIFSVNFRGNGYTSLEKAQDFCLLRCAEVALDNGFTHFIIVDSGGYEQNALVSMPTTSSTTGTATVSGGVITGQATTTTYGGQTFVVSRPRTKNMILCFHGKPENAPLALNARFVYDSITAKYNFGGKP